MEVSYVKDRELLYTGLSQAAWGYFLVHFNFNLGLDGMTVNILPEFAGFLLLLSAIGKLSSERRDLALLRPLCVLLTAWHWVKWALAIVGFDLDSVRFIYLGLIVMAATLYFHFQFLTDMAALAEKYQPAGETLDRRIRGRGTVLLVLTTAADLLGDLAQLLWNEEQVVLLSGAVFCLVVVLLIVIILIMISLFQLRRFVRETETPLMWE